MPRRGIPGTRPEALPPENGGKPAPCTSSSFSSCVICASSARARRSALGRRRPPTRPSAREAAAVPVASVEAASVGVPPPRRRAAWRSSRASAVARSTGRAARSKCSGSALHRCLLVGVGRPGSLGRVVGWPALLRLAEQPVTHRVVLVGRHPGEVRHREEVGWRCRTRCGGAAPPAARTAATARRLKSAGTTGSAAAWKAHSGFFASTPTRAGSPAAAHRHHCREQVRFHHVPGPGAEATLRDARVR